MSLEQAIMDLVEALKANTRVAEEAFARMCETVAAPVEPLPEKRGRGRPPKVAVPEDPLPADLPIVDDLSFGDDPEEDEAPAYTVADVRRALKVMSTVPKLGAKTGLAVASEIVRSRGYRNVAQIQEGDVAGMVDDIIASGGTIEAAG